MRALHAQPAIVEPPVPCLQYQGQLIGDINVA
jgi:hypothetical protein